MKKIILFITLFLCIITTAFAEEVTLVKEKIDNVYTHYYDLNYSKVRFLYAEKNFFNGTTAYCIEIGKPIESNIYTYTTSFEENNISAADLNYLKLVAYYGYDYPGHHTDKYYMAAQELIWNRMCRTYTNWITDLNPNQIIDISKEKEDIIILMEEHYKKPSFDNEEIEFTMGQELVLEDTNNVLNYFETTSDNIVIDGNKLIIKENFSEEEITFTKPDYAKKQFFLYTSGASQKMISPGTVDSVTSTLKIKLVGGSITLNKLDKDTNTNIPEGDATLNGAIYELYDEEGILFDTLVTGTKDSLEKLPLGKYTLKEKTPPKGYLLDENIYTFEITEDNLNVNLNVYDEVIRRKVEIFKVFASNTTGELIGEPNINFEIYNQNNIIIDTITTDAEGHVSINLPYGTYTFKQINTTPDYYKVEDFTVTISEYDERPIYKLLSDSAITAKVKIIKKDLDTKENIINSSVKFKIFDVQNNKYLSLKVSYPENKLSEEFQVDKNGVFITPTALPPGDYILEEVPQSVDGYLYNSSKIPFTIGASSDFIEEDGELYLEIPFYNQRVKGSIIISKYGEEVAYNDNTFYYKEIPLEGAIFHLYADVAIYENDRLIYQKDELVEELTTDKNGKVNINNLPLGNYYLKEISTPNNHILSEDIYPINLSYEDENTEIVTKELEIKNYLPKGILVVNKYETGTKKAIPNTLIEVRTIDNNIIFKGYTDENGQITIDNLPYGAYYLSEVESSTGYRLLEEEITFNITDEVTEIDIYNERIIVPNTGFSLKILDIFVILIILLGIVLIIFFPKEKNIVLLSVLIIILGITYFLVIAYKYYDDDAQNQKSINAYLNNEIETITEAKYQYNSILEIPSIELRRGVLEINNEYNKAQYNIELIKEDESTIILASHNGNNYNSYFKDLHTIELGAEINYYQNGIIYHYIYTDSYDIEKNGYADLYYKTDTKSIILITCKDNTDSGQTVFIGYLKDTSTY